GADGLPGGRGGDGVTRRRPEHEHERDDEEQTGAHPREVADLGGSPQGATPAAAPAVRFVTSQRISPARSAIPSPQWRPSTRNVATWLIQSYAVPSRSAAASVIVYWPLMRLATNDISSVHVSPASRVSIGTPRSTVLVE